MARAKRPKQTSNGRVPPAVEPYSGQPKACDMELPAAGTAARERMRDEAVAVGYRRAQAFATATQRKRQPMTYGGKGKE